MECIVHFEVVHNDGPKNCVDCCFWIREHLLEKQN